jgi:3-oxoacyl-[acyl-carrier-protein] synthase III
VAFDLTQVVLCPGATAINFLQVQAAIGAKNAVAFDLTAACSGFVLAMVTAAQYIRTGMAKHVLVIGADAMSRLVDWRDRGGSETKGHSQEYPQLAHCYFCYAFLLCCWQ